MTRHEDVDFQDVKINKVRKIDGEEVSYELVFEDGWMLHIPSYDGMPTSGSTARLYGGLRVRGIDVDGIEVFYRTSEEDQKYHNELYYGKDANEMLQRWDKGQNIWSIEMGGLGPGYEQAIQILMMEIIRDEINNPLPEKEGWPIWADATVDRLDDKLGGFSGAQVHAAKGLAFQFLRLGPIKVMTEEAVEDDRKIQICKHFPSLD